MTIFSTSSTNLLVSRESQSIMVPRCLERSPMQVVICPYCGVLSQNAPSDCSHIWRHLGLTFACRGCRKFHTEAPKKLQEHLGKCKEALAVKQQLNSRPPKTKLVRRRRNSWRHLPPSPHHSLMEVSGCLGIFVCSYQEQGGRTSMLNQQGRQSLPSQQLVTLEMFILSIFPIYDSC